MEPTEQTRHQQNRATFLGLVLTFLFGGFLFLFLVVVTGGFFLYVLGAVVGITMVGYLHYLLWGHSLMRETAGEREEEEARERWENDQAAEETQPRRRF
jgi:predicted tellurium resistance membrane protein TerC